MGAPVTGYKEEPDYVGYLASVFTMFEVTSLVVSEISLACEQIIEQTVGRSLGRLYYGCSTKEDGDCRLQVERRGRLSCSVMSNFL